MRRLLLSCLPWLVGSACALSPARELSDNPGATTLPNGADRSPDAQGREPGAHQTGEQESDGRETNGTETGSTDDDGAETESTETDGTEQTPPGRSDAGMRADAGRDASIRVDVALRDSGRDAAVASPAPAGPSLVDTVIKEFGVSCKSASDCVTPCLPVGVVSCCRADKVCGCTWAPGAYCF